MEVDGKAKFVQAGSGFLSQHTNSCISDSAAPIEPTVRIHWPSGAEQQFRDLAAGFRYEITEGSDQIISTRFIARREIPSGETRGENEARFSDAWLIEPVPLPEQHPGPGFIKLDRTMSDDRAALYSLFRRYLFDWRAELEMPIWFLVDGQNRAQKIYFGPPDPADLKRMANPNRLELALPFSGRYYSEPERSFYVLGVAFLLAGFPEQALLYLQHGPQDNYKVLLAIGQIHPRGRPAQASPRIPGTNY